MKRRNDPARPARSRRRALRKLMRPLALPEDTPRGEARVTLYADARAFIENHSGIIEFDDVHVRVGARRMALTVRGEGLMLDCCEAHSLIVRGTISGIELETRGGAHE